ncbi:MAG: extracellular solute-binding protein [Clostridiales bacterium]|nr:extracellular solute-binding protein [Clostridiales bacterium]
MANVHLSGSRAKSAFRKAAAGLLAASLLLPAVGCKRSVKNKNENRYASGKKISETDPYFDAKVSPVKFPERPGREIDNLHIHSCEYIGDLALISYEIHYKLPEGKATKEEAITPEYGDLYYERSTAIFDVDGNLVRYLNGDLATVYDVTTDKDGNVCLFYSYYDTWLSENFKVEVLDAEGNKIRSIIIYDPPIYHIVDDEGNAAEVVSAEMLEEVPDTKITMLDDGGVAIVGNGKMYTYNEKGVRLCKCYDSFDRTIEGRLIRNNGKYYVVSVNPGYGREKDIKLKEVDVMTGKLGEGIDAGELAGYGEIQSTDQGIFVSSSGGCSKYDMDTKEITEVFNWNDTDVDRTMLGRISFTPKDENEYFAVSIVQKRTTVEPYLIHLTRAEKNPHAGKSMIVVGGMFLTDDELMSFVDAYNRAPESKARAIIVDYAEGLTMQDPRDDVERQLYLDLFSGNGPDILVNMGDKEAFRNGEIMEDLNPYMDGENGISRDGFFDNIFRACERGGKLYHVPVKVNLSGFLVNSDLVKYPDGWTYDEFDQAARSMPEQVSFMEGTLHNDMLKIFLSTSLPRFVDYEKKKVDVQNDDMRRLLEMTNEYAVRIIPGDEGKKVVSKSNGTEIYEVGIHDFTRDKFNEGILAVRDKKIYSVNEYCLDSNQNQGRVSFIGYPGPQRTGMAVTPRMSLGIVSSGSNKDLAWDFIRAYLMYDVPEDVQDMGLSVNRSVFDKQCRREMEEENRVYDDWVKKLGRLPPADIFAKITEEDIDELRVLMDHADVSCVIDQAMFDVISEEAAAYFAGDRSMDEVLKLIDNRTSLIVSEY